ncbi:lantibiotic dehydratase [Nocardioides insulae]|uniref:lantibiotic dehydratase n=1 Tax=Nocardioides insulae TaxID=394734 RepID=UPI00056AE676|nr:lantibiotic dehydratase [Nocardioides insulae]
MTEPDDWTLTPELMVRVAGLPVETLAGLRCPQTLAWAERVLAEEVRLRAAAAALAEALGELVVRLEEKSERARLLRLRRDVFNLRMPGITDLEALLGSLDTPLDDRLRDRVGDHLCEVARLDELRALGDSHLAAEGPASRAALRRLLAEPRLRAGLLLASPGLEAQIDAYVGASADAPAKRARKVERSAVSYLSRSVAKPSPFSTFTGVALGQVAAPDTDPQVPTEWTSSVRINVVALTRLGEAIAADPDRRGDLPVRPASGWGRDSDRVRYVRRSLRAGDTAATVTFDSARDQLFFLRRSDILEEILALADGGPALLHRDLVSGLATRLGAATQECEQYVTALLELGLLQVPVLATNVHAVDPLRSFRDALRELDRPWSRQLATALDHPVECLDDYPTATPARRRTLLAELRRGLGAAMTSLGADPQDLPNTLIYEDVRATRTPLPWSGESVADALRTLERVLPAFDLTRRHRLTLRGFFVARHGVGGRCEDLLRLVHDFHEDIYDEYLSWVSRHSRVDDSGRLVDDPNFLGDRRVAALDRARRVFAEGLGRVLAEHPEAEEVEVGADLVDAVAAELVAESDGLTAHTHFLQPADGDQMVLNQVYGGLGFPFSRFTHCFAGDGLVERLRHRARALTPPGTVLAEVTGGAATTNLNLHHRLTDHEIVCPGETSSAPPEQRIDLADLVVEHDPDLDRLVLRSRRLGVEVVPVYFGYLLPQALPAIARTLLLLSPSATLWFEPWAGVPGALESVRLPRLRMGPLVLARRSWTVSVRDLPAETGSSAEQFLAWQRWRARLGLPVRVFARVHPPEGAAGRRPKPQFLDLASELSLASFRGFLADPDSRVEITELLPDPDRATVRSGAGRHVAEYAVETVAVERIRTLSTTRRSA